MIEPAANTELLGHARAEQAARRAFETGRMPHAWLISGPEGIGKATMAYRIARFLLASAAARAGQPGLAVARGDPVFRALAAGSHPDLRILQREINEKTGKRKTKIGIDQARAVIEFMHRTAALGGWRVVIIDATDDLSEEAGDALLKAMEEPPARAVFLLVAHAAGAIKPTIRSRCRQLVLESLDEHDFRLVVRRHQPQLGDEEIAKLGRLAEGSAGRALALLQGGGLATLKDVEMLLAGMPAVEPGPLETVVDSVLKRGEDAHRVLRDVLLWWTAERVRSGASSEAADSATLDRWAALWEKIAHDFARAEAASLDRKQVILEILYGIRATARAA